MEAKSAKPGERWLVNLQPIDAAKQERNEVTATLEDYDARTDTWMVQPDGANQSVAVLAIYLIRRLS